MISNWLDKGRGKGKKGIVGGGYSICKGREVGDRGLFLELGEFVYLEYKVLREVVFKCCFLVVFGFFICKIIVECYCGI